MKKDILFSEYREKVADFIFDDKVASVFDNMIRRSVPGYATVIAMTKVFAEQYVQENSHCYDLGCALGTSALAMRKGITKPNCTIIAVDNSPAMIEHCEGIFESDISQTSVQLKCSDILDIEIKNASLVVMNFTLQFLDPEHRDKMIQRIYKGLLPGGVLLLSEKICFKDEKEQAFQTMMYEDFKRLNGYSDLEISQKRKALENVLIPDTFEQHKERILKSGFDSCYLWFQCFTFLSIAAYKQ